jgi:hypothetical protein
MSAEAVLRPAMSQNGRVGSAALVGEQSPGYGAFGCYRTGAILQQL